MIKLFFTPRIEEKPKRKKKKKKALTFFLDLEFPGNRLPRKKLGNFPVLPFLKTHDEVRKIPFNSNLYGVSVNWCCVLRHAFHLHRRLGWVEELCWFFERSDFHFLGLSLPLLFLLLCSHWPRLCSSFLCPWYWRQWVIWSRTQEKCKLLQAYIWAWSVWLMRKLS